MAASPTTRCSWRLRRATCRRCSKVWPPYPRTAFAIPCRPMASRATRAQVSPSPTPKRTKRKPDLSRLLGRLDGVAGANDAAVQVAAGLAEPRAPQAHLAHPELAPDQVIEGHPGRGDVAAALRRGDLDGSFGGQGVEGFRLDEGDFTAARARLVRVIARAEEVPVTFEAATGHRARLGHRLHGLARRPRDVDRDHGSLPHGRHARRGAVLKQASWDATLPPPAARASKPRG